MNNIPTWLSWIEYQALNSINERLKLHIDICENSKNYNYIRKKQTQQQKSRIKVKNNA